MSRAQKNTRAFTDPVVRAFPTPGAGKREVYWDQMQPGLHLLVSARSRVFRSQYKLYGQWVSRKLGLVGAARDDDDDPEATFDVNWARMQAKRDRQDAERGIDPRAKARALLPDTTSFEAVVDQFIEHYAKPRQRSWQQTERTLKVTCSTWLRKPFTSVTKADARMLLRGFMAKGNGPKARVTLAWLRTLWKWAVQEDIVPANIMLAVTIEYEPQARDRFYDDDELRAIWLAAEALDPVERDYIKLLMLLAPRKTALAGMRRSHLDDVANPTLWTTPFELTKSRKLRVNDDPKRKRRVYLTPLPALAQRILKARLKEDSDLVFPGRTRGKPIWPGSPLTRKLIKAGAPADFNYHAFRHTIASWFEEYSDFEVGLLLNHSASGVTAGYRHSHALKLKLTLLSEWAAHVEELVTPKGVALLR